MKRSCAVCGAAIPKGVKQCPSCSASVPKKKRSLSGRLLLCFGVTFVLVLAAYLVLLFLRVGNPLHLWGTQRALDHYFGMFDLYYTMDSYDPQKVADQIAGNAPEEYWESVYGSDWEDEILSYVEDVLNGDHPDGMDGMVSYGSVLVSGMPEEKWDSVHGDREQEKVIKSMRVKVLSVRVQPKDSVLYDEWNEKCDFDIDQIATVSYELTSKEDGETETERGERMMVQYDGTWYPSFAGYEEGLD